MLSQYYLEKEHRNSQRHVNVQSLANTQLQEPIAAKKIEMPNVIGNAQDYEEDDEIDLASTLDIRT